MLVEIQHLGDPCRPWYFSMLVALLYIVSSMLANGQRL